ncbi:MAG: hypothetical protein ACYTBJ_25965 [Planctomycetota bacterium]|jgi:hypothetical protein
MVKNSSLEDDGFMRVSNWQCMILKSKPKRRLVGEMGQRTAAPSQVDGRLRPAIGVECGIEKLPKEQMR